MQLALDYPYSCGPAYVASSVRYNEGTLSPGREKRAACLFDYWKGDLEEDFRYYWVRNVLNDLSGMDLCAS